MHIARGDIWSADLGQPSGSEAGYRRPVVIVQSDALNQSRLTSYVAIPLTSSTARSAPSWNLLLSAASTGLDRDSVAQSNLILTIPENRLIERIGGIGDAQVARLLSCLDIALGRA